MCEIDAGSVDRVDPAKRASPGGVGMEGTQWREYLQGLLVDKIPYPKEETEQRHAQRRKGVQ